MVVVYTEAVNPTEVVASEAVAAASVEVLPKQVLGKFLFPKRVSTVLLNNKLLVQFPIIWWWRPWWWFRWFCCTSQRWIPILRCWTVNVSRRQRWRWCNWFKFYNKSSVGNLNQKCVFSYFLNNLQRCFVQWTHLIITHKRPTWPYLLLFLKTKKYHHFSWVISVKNVPYHRFFGSRSFDFFSVFSSFRIHKNKQFIPEGTQLNKNDLFLLYMSISFVQLSNVFGKFRVDGNGGDKARKDAKKAINKFHYFCPNFIKCVCMCVVWGFV